MKIEIEIPKEYISKVQYQNVLDSIDTAISNEDVPTFTMDWEEYDE